MSWQPGVTLYQLEKNAIESAMKFYGGNKQMVASSLGIALKTLYNKLDVYEGDAKREREAELARREEQRKQTEKFRNGVQPEPRIHLESTPQTPKEPSVPLREREKVQKMSSR